MSLERINQLPKFSVNQDTPIHYIKLDPEVTIHEVRAVLDLLFDSNHEMTFHDTLYPSVSDPGAYFSYSSKGLSNNATWHMSIGNHGWSGGIYQIGTEAIAQQITNLANQDKLIQLRVSRVPFLSYRPIESTQKSHEQEKKLLSLHATNASMGTTPNC